MAILLAHGLNTYSDVPCAGPSHAETVIEAAAEEPDEYGHLVKQMD
jgi:hypothetical protein